jgi:hypothetical protein
MSSGRDKWYDEVIRGLPSGSTWNNEERLEWYQKHGAHTVASNYKVNASWVEILELIELFGE